MKAKNLLEGLERYDNYAVCPGCQSCEGKKVIACRDLIWQAAARIRGQERQIECLMDANEGHRRMLVHARHQHDGADPEGGPAARLPERMVREGRARKNSAEGAGFLRPVGARGARAVVRAAAGA